MPAAFAGPSAGAPPTSPSSSDSQCSPVLNDSEAAILAALGSQLLTSKEIARQAGLSRTHQFAAALGNLYRLGLLVKTSNERWARAAALTAEGDAPPGHSLGDELRAVRRELRAIRKLLRRLARPPRPLVAPAEVPPAQDQVPPPAQGAVAAGEVVSPSGCGPDIVRVLREAGRRLTLPALLEQLRQRGLNWDEQTVQRELARLVQTGKAHEHTVPGVSPTAPASP